MKTIHSQIICVPQNDIDTDIIIPAEYLSTTNKIGLGEGLFKALRTDKNFVFNNPKYRLAKILVAGNNFGCGSSREHAPWALKDWGIDVVIAPSFADIFKNNSMKNQLLPIELPEKIVHKILKMDPCEITIDLQNQAVTLSDKSIHKFEIDPYSKECLIEELDDLDYLFKNLKAIKKYDKKHRGFIR